VPPTPGARGHLPGALAVHWRDDLQDPVRRDFIGPEAFAALMDRLGVGNDTQVVLYGGNSNWFAAYAYWYFRFYGHRAVRLLDGGRKTWELEGRPLTTDVPEPAPGHGYRVGGPAEEIRALRAQVLEAAGSGDGAALVDVRSPEEYRGEVMAPPHLPQEAAQRPGSHPGRGQHPLGQGGRPREGHVPARRAAAQPVRGPGSHPRSGGHRLLPHRRALSPHLVRAA
jgi:thiosulfate/3-mercaptopyruvate sulfurtransferase